MSSWLKHVDVHRAHEKRPKHRKIIHPLFRPRSANGLGLHISSAMKDVLHISCLGVALHANGNTLFYLVFSDFFGSVAEKNMAVVWKLIQEEYRKQSVSNQFHCIEISSSCSALSPMSDYPIMSGKGAENRCLVPVLLEIVRNHMREDIQEDRIIFKMLKCLTAFYDILNEGSDDGNYPFVLPKAVHARLTKAVDEFLLFYSLLSQLAVDSSPPRLAWKKVSKHHMMVHLASEAAQLNPRLSWCYANEDYVGRVSRIAHACRHGTPPALRSEAVSQRVVTGFVLRLVHEQRWQ